jgi:glutaconate CoA-transferase subunit B
MEGQMVHIADIMAYALAKEVKNGEIFLQGLSSPLPMLAGHIAKKFLAPDATYINVADSIDPETEKLPASTADTPLTRRPVAFCNLFDAFDIAQQGKLGMIFLGAAQIDKFGNTNLSVIGDYYKPKVRLPGGAASSFLCAIANRTVLWVTNQTNRGFVEKVDFITGQGYLTGGNARKELGLPGAGPAKVITNLATYDFEPESKHMRLCTIHPGITLEQVKENCGFELIIPDNIKETEIPPKEILDFIEKIDPDNVRKLGVKVL